MVLVSRSCKIPDLEDTLLRNAALLAILLSRRPSHPVSLHRTIAVNETLKVLLPISLHNVPVWRKQHVLNYTTILVGCDGFRFPREALRDVV